MSDDRELLELAAKAISKDLLGYNWYQEKYNTEEFGYIQYAGDATHIWNPLRFDGDALRLAVKLDIGIHGNFPKDAVVCFDGRRVIEPKEHNNPMVAVRRAIVRAAATIGVEMV